MVGTKRRQAIEGRITRDGEATLADLAAEHGVSEMTIRRDLEILEASRGIRRVRGGAISTFSRSYEPPLSDRLVRSHGAKERIGAAAAELLAPGESAIIDVGTTALELARCLRGRRGCTVVTASLMVAMELSADPAIRVISTGGLVRPGEMSLIGPGAEDSFSGVNCDVVFLGVGGVDVEAGLTEYNLDDTRVKQAAIRSARRVVVLADVSKLGRVTFSTVAPLTKVDTLVTDAGPDHPVVVGAMALGVDVLHVASTPAINQEFT